MKREQKLTQLEELCQQRYAIIDSCYHQIDIAQRELAKLETKYLKVKASLDSSEPKRVIVRQRKIDKLRKGLSDLGLTSEDIANLLKENK